MPDLRQRKINGGGSQVYAEEAGGVESLPRAKLQWTWLSLFLSALQISFGFLLGKTLPFLVPQPSLPKGKNLSGTVTIVTGQAGIGYEIAKEQYLRGSHVVLACRNRGKAEDARVRIIKEVAAQCSTKSEKSDFLRGAEDRLEVAILDCSSLENVRSFCSTWSASKRQIDYLFLNAGIASIGEQSSRFTEEGFDMV
jgi:hypothetical protein